MTPDALPEPRTSIVVFETGLKRPGLVKWTWMVCDPLSPKLQIPSPECQNALID